MKLILFYFLLFSSVTTVFSQKSHIKSFFRGVDGIQYFIKPIIYQTVDKEKLTIDFTLNVINDTVIKIVSNFSSSKNKIKNLLIDSTSYSVNKLFDDFDSKTIYSRYTFDLNFRDFKKLFSNEPIVIVQMKYFIKKSFRKKSNFIKDNFIANLFSF